MTLLCKERILTCVLLAFSLLYLNTAQATIFDFDITFDGINATVDASSDPVAGTTLVPGSDGFNLDIHTAGNDFWNVVTSTNLGVYAGFYVEENGARTGNVTTTFFLNGAQVAQDIDLGLVQANVHMGAEIFNLAVGTIFDQVVVDYTFLASTSSFTTIQNSPDIIEFFPFFRDSNIDYVTGVPEPSTLALMVFGFAGIGYKRYRSKKVA